jgi:outer membrane murein-binding lipoprotein Lpp
MSRRPELTPMSVPDRPLQSGGGGGTYDGMETRVAVLETHVVHIREDIGDLKANVSTLMTDVSSLKSDVSVVKSDVSTLRAEVSSLKSDVKDIRSDLGKMSDKFGSSIEALNDKFGSSIETLKVDLATLKERVNHLPSKGFIVSATLSTLAVMTALILFQDHIKALVAH